MELIFEKSVSGRSGVSLPVADVPRAAELPENLRRREAAPLPEVSELDLVRHFTNLSRRNFAIDTNFYPLGSCTMKYNPRILETAAGLFADCHPMIAGLPGGERFTRVPSGSFMNWAASFARLPVWMKWPPSRWQVPTAR